MVSALTRAFFSLLHPRMLWLMVWPTLVALGTWLVLAAVFGAQAAQWIDDRLMQTSIVQWMLQYAVLAFIAAHISTVILVLAFIPLVLVTAVLILGVFSMPVMVEHVASRDYPTLERRRGGTFAGSVWNAVVAFVMFLALAVVTLPLWLLPFLWPVLPIVLLAFLNRRVFTYDALAEHASDDEIRLIARRYRGDLWLLAILVALAGYVPILGFFAPVFGGLAFIHYGLDRLSALRSEPLEGTAVRVP